MSALHIYTAGWQPFTKFRDASGNIFRHDPRAVYRCMECRDWRWASKLKVQAYYDYWNVQCADGCYGERGTRP